MRWYIFANVLAIEREHPYLPADETQVIDDTQPATFPTPFGSPTNFANATGSGNDLSEIGMLIQMSL